MKRKIFLRYFEIILLHKIKMKNSVFRYIMQCDGFLGFSCSVWNTHTGTNVSQQNYMDETRCRTQFYLIHFRFYFTNPRLVCLLLVSK